MGYRSDVFILIKGTDKLLNKFSKYYPEEYKIIYNHYSSIHLNNIYYYNDKDIQWYDGEDDVEAFKSLVSFTENCINDNYKEYSNTELYYYLVEAGYNGEDDVISLVKNVNSYSVYITYELHISGPHYDINVSKEYINDLESKVNYSNVPIGDYDFLYSICSDGYINIPNSLNEEKFKLLEDFINKGYVYIGENETLHTCKFLAVIFKSKNIEFFDINILMNIIKDIFNYYKTVVYDNEFEIYQEYILVNKYKGIIEKDGKNIFGYMVKNICIDESKDEFKTLNSYMQLKTSLKE